MRLLSGLLFALLLPLPALSAPGGEKVLLTLDEALELAFPGCEVERETVYMTKDQSARVGKLAGTKPQRSIVHPYVASKDGKVVGTAYVEAHRVRTLRETLFVVVDTEQRVRRIEVLSFGEPENYLPRGAWYAQFLGKRLDDELNLKRGIRGISGATLTARATTDSVRRALALHQVVTAPPGSLEAVTRAEAWTLHVSNALVGGTGIVYAWMRYFTTPADEFAVVNHPWQPAFQHLHLLGAPLLVFGSGLIFHRHVFARLRSGFRPRRPTGLLLALMLVPMIASGYLLQTSSGDPWRTIWIAVHLATSALWIAGYAIHLLSSRGGSGTDRELEPVR